MDLPAERNLDASIVEVSDLKDQLEILYGKRRERRRSMAWLGLAATAFLVWGMMYGTPGYVAAAFLTVFQIVPVARHIEISDKIKRREWKLARLLLPRGSVGDPGRGANALADGGSAGDPGRGMHAPTDGASGSDEGPPDRGRRAPDDDRGP